MTDEQAEQLLAEVVKLLRPAASESGNLDQLTSNGTLTEPPFGKPCPSMGSSSVVESPA